MIVSFIYLDFQIYKFICKFISHSYRQEITEMWWGKSWTMNQKNSERCTWLWWRFTWKKKKRRQMKIVLDIFLIWFFFRFGPPFYRQSHMWRPCFFIFFLNPPLLTIFFDSIFFFVPTKYGINLKLNSWWKVISSCLEGYKTTLFCAQCFHKQHQIRIWFELITTSSIARR